MKSYTYTRALAWRTVKQNWLVLGVFWLAGVVVALLLLELRWAVFAAAAWAEVLALPGALVYKIEMSQVGATVFPGAALHIHDEAGDE